MIPLLTAESKEEPKSCLMRVKEENEKSGLKLNIQNTKILSSSPVISWQMNREKVKTDRYYFLGLQNNCGLYQQT